MSSCPAVQDIPAGAQSSYAVSMHDDDSKFYAPDADFILALAGAAIASLPATFRTQASSITLNIQDFVEGETFDDLGLQDPYELASLFETDPDTIWLFRRPILDEWAERGDICLADLVLHIIVQELVGHFGWADAEIAAHPLLSVALRGAQERLTAREG